MQSQVPVKEFIEPEFDESYYSQFEKNKIIPQEVRKPILVALSFYPELKDVSIEFRLKKRKTPLTARPTIWSVFKKNKKRTYLITISTETIERFSPILFHNLSYNAKIGVIGHEIGHIATYHQMCSGKVFGLIFKLMNSKFTDSFEYNTDLTAIKHGLGYQLLTWSKEVRENLDLEVWQGTTNNGSEEKRERYMNPSTIEKQMKELSIYSKILD